MYQLEKTWSRMGESVKVLDLHNVVAVTAHANWLFQHVAWKKVFQPMEFAFQIRSLKRTLAPLTPLAS